MAKITHGTTHLLIIVVSGEKLLVAQLPVLVRVKELKDILDILP